MTTLHLVTGERITLDEDKHTVECLLMAANEVLHLGRFSWTYKGEKYLAESLSIPVDNIKRVT